LQATWLGASLHVAASLSCRFLLACLQVANMHGDEPGGRVLLPMLAEWMCSKQSSDARASRIINDMHLVSVICSWPTKTASADRADL